jgi:hypothetical protein
MFEVSRRANEWPLATFTLPSAQLCGQISAWFDLAIAAALASLEFKPSALSAPVSPDWKEPLAAKLRAWSERTLDLIQVLLTRRWKVVDFAIAFVLVYGILEALVASSVGAPFATYRGVQAMTDLFTPAVPALFVALLVPQFRPWIERWMLRR